MNNEEIISLHKYFITANIFYDEFHNYIKYNKEDKYFTILSQIKMWIWYSSLYIVVEWWEELSLNYNNINLLLENEKNLKNLKLFRNWFFHYQKKYWNEKNTWIINDKLFIEWIGNLHREFSNWFISNLS